MHRQIFSNLREVVAVNAQFLQGLDDIMAEWDSERSTLGPHMQHFAPFFKCYGPYVEPTVLGHTASCKSDFMFRCILCVCFLPALDFTLGHFPHHAHRYAASYASAVFLLEREKTANEDLREFIENAVNDAKTSAHFINNVLVMPVQRVPRHVAICLPSCM